ncbi:hypothetical protein NIES298_19580 [Microcystis aeruginosa NIES-298]|nr:hypothetical protein NIES298_19580 [Microcystis aeruginosa NIES-298]
MFQSLVGFKINWSPVERDGMIFGWAGSFNP